MMLLTQKVTSVPIVLVDRSESGNSLLGVNTVQTVRSDGPNIQLLLLGISGVYQFDHLRNCPEYTTSISSC